MEHKRDGVRRRVLKGATLEFNGAGGISCTVRNISELGACLAVESPLGIPDVFELVVKTDGSRHSCNVAWRSEKQIGVAFEKPASLARGRAVGTAPTIRADRIATSRAYAGLAASGSCFGE